MNEILPDSNGQQYRDSQPCHLMLFGKFVFTQRFAVREKNQAEPLFKKTTLRVFNASSFVYVIWGRGAYYCRPSLSHDWSVVLQG